MKFFISYSRSVKEDVRAVIELLRKSGHEVWWDADIPMMDDWWATILKNIEWCEVFIFMISEKSVTSEYCMAELRYGIARNRPVLPFILDDHTRYTIPSELGRRQWFVHDGNAALMLAQIIHDCQKLDLNSHRDTYAPRPPEPNTGEATLTKQYQQAVSLAEDGHFAEAIKRFRNVASLDADEWGIDCQQWVQRLQLYTEIADLADHKATLKRAITKWEAYLKQYDTEFDPMKIQEKLAQATIVTPSKPNIKTILPAPVDWIEIPAGKITLTNTWDNSKDAYLKKGEPQIFEIAAFAISKYPVTNAQFKHFIDAKGYENKSWWTNAGWEARIESSHFDGEWKPSGIPWTGLRYWNDSNWNSDFQPVVGVSWHEALAFCIWLRDMTGIGFMLPTEQQWQRAAQGSDDRKYPWGNEWDKSRCRNSVGGMLGSVGNTSPVTLYEGNGLSPFGIADMAGNVWEWCRTTYDTGSQEIDGMDERVLRGGSWFNNDADDFSCTNRIGYHPNGRGTNIGFRLVYT